MHTASGHFIIGVQIAFLVASRLVGQNNHAVDVAG